VECDSVSSSKSRIERTQQALQEAILELIAEKGYDRITVENILRRADVGRTTFYEHFESKEDLLLRRMDSIPWVVRGDDASNPFDVRFLFEHVAEQSRLVAGLKGTPAFDEALNRLRGNVLANLIELLQENANETNESMDVQLTAHALTGAVMQLLVWWLDAGMPESPTTMANWFNQFAKRMVEK